MYFVLRVNIYNIYINICKKQIRGQVWLAKCFILKSLSQVLSDRSISHVDSGVFKQSIDLLD